MRFAAGHSIACCVAAATIFTAIRADARGQNSYLLPEVRGPAAIHTRSEPSLWSHAVDPPTPAGQILAIGGGIVAFSTGGRVCAFDAESGRERWCSLHGANPAYAGGVIAFTGSDGNVRGLDGQTGSIIWSADRQKTPLGSSPTVFGARTDFVIVGHEVRDGAMKVSDISLDGTLRWSAALPPGSIGRFTLALPFALLQTTSAGATIVSSQVVLRLGAGGGVVGTLANAWDVADVENDTAVIAGDWTTEEVEDRFLTFDLETVELKTASVAERFHFEPDYDDNVGFWRSGALPRHVEYFADVRADADFAYVAIPPKLYRYRLADVKTQRPLLVVADGTFLGGPYRGVLYAQRDDGVWAFRIGRSVINSRLVVPSPIATTTMTAAEKTACFGFHDGTVHCVDADSGQALLGATTVMPSHIAIEGGRVFVVGQDSTGWRVAAFSLAQE